MQYLHADVFSPVPATWIKAIQKGFFTSWPGLTDKDVGKYLPKSIAAHKGHLGQMRKNVHSTQPKGPELTEPPNGEAVRSTQECQLQLDQLPAQARTGHVLPGLARHSLIYIVHLCYAGCTAEFTANKVKVKKDVNILIGG